MSTLRTNALEGVDDKSTINVTLNEGNTITENLIHVIGKHWCHFTGTGTIAINDSINASSLTDEGTGDYEVIFTNNMSNAVYACVAGTAGDGVRVFGLATSKIDRLIGIANDGSVEDGSFYTTQIDGDLA